MRPGAAGEAAWEAGAGSASQQPEEGRGTAAAEQMAVLRIRGLAVAYGGSEVVRGLDLEVGAGEAVGLRGPSGCGKSTVARAVLGLLPRGGGITAGSVELMGRRTAELTAREWRRWRGALVAMAAQEAELALNPVRRVGSQIAAVLRAHPEAAPARRWGRQAVRQRVAEALEEMGLAAWFARAYPHQLSGGQRQRVVLARALACGARACPLPASLAPARGPALLIADEPTTGLDAATREQILAALRRRVEAGMALLIISHEAEVLEQIAGRVVEMPSGAGRAGPGVARRALGPAREAARSTLADRSARSSGEPRGSPRPTRTRPVAPPLAPLLRARGLEKVYRRGGREVAALAGVDAEIQRDETVVLMGPSGAGKSTLARCLAGLEPPDRGQIWRAADLGARGVQMIWQDAAGALNPRMRVEEIIAEPWRIGGERLTAAERQRRAGELLEQAGLPAAWMRRKPGELSGGEKRRVGLARALAVDPKLLILDEALASLEPELQEELLRWLEALQARRELSYLFITHDRALAARIGGRQLRLQAGRLAEAAACAV